MYNMKQIQIQNHHISMEYVAIAGTLFLEEPQNGKTYMNSKKHTTLHVNNKQGVLAIWKRE